MSRCPAQRNYRGVADIYEDRVRLFCIAGGGTRLEVGVGAGHGGQWAGAVGRGGGAFRVVCVWGPLVRG